VVFGEERDLSGYSMSGLTDYTYTGQRSLDEGMGGLMDYRARFYSPYINHFTQPDTIVPDLLNPQSLNRYAYTLDNPIRYNDPTGHCVPLCSGAIGLAVGLVAGAIMYAANNQGEDFDWGELAMAAGAGAIAGGLIGSGLALIAAPATTGLALTAATAMVGGGTGMAFSSGSYMVRNRNSFDKGSFAMETAAGGAIGAVGAVSGPVGKIAANVAGAELLYLGETAYRGRKIKMMDAAQAGGIGLASGLVDAGVSRLMRDLAGTGLRTLRAPHSDALGWDPSLYQTAATGAVKMEAFESLSSGTLSTITVTGIEETIIKKYKRFRRFEQ
jgi:RHS repeat-associated protein